MIALMMAGGRGSRMPSFVEKLTLGYGEPAALRVVRALKSCPDITRMVAAVSPHTPRTRMLLEAHMEVIDTAGSGYSTDVSGALKRLEGNVLVLPADLPLVDGHILGRILRLHKKGFWTTILITERYATSLGVSPGLTIRLDGTLYRYAGISMVNAAHTDVPTQHVVLDDHRLAANMNTPQDWALLGSLHNTGVRI